MSDSIDRRRFLGMAAVSALSAADAAGHMAEAGAIPLGEVDGGRAVAGARRANPLLTEARDFVDVSRGNPKPYTLKGEALAKARLTPRDLAAGDRRRRVVRGRPAVPAGGRHGARPGGARGAGQDARRQVPEGDAVQQHPFAARPGALGRRAAPRGAPARRQGRQRPAGLLLGVPQRRPGPALPVVAAATTGRWRRPPGSRRRWSPIGSTARTSRSSAAGRSAWWCPGRTGSSRSSGSSGSS